MLVFVWNAYCDDSDGDSLHNPVCVQFQPELPLSPLTSLGAQRCRQWGPGAWGGQIRRNFPVGPGATVSPHECCAFLLDPVRAPCPTWAS